MSRTDLKRTSMYAGGSSPGKLLEAQFYHEDCLVYDLEDSVAQGEKDAARFLVYQMVRYHRPKDKYVIVRVNGIYSDYIEQDLEAVVRARPDALRIPKVERAEEVNRIDQRVAQIEVAAGIPVGSTELWCNIESALGVANANEIGVMKTDIGIILNVPSTLTTIGMLIPAIINKDCFEKKPEVFPEAFII